MAVTIQDAVAERFRQLCAQRGIKSNELANLSGVTPSMVYSLLDQRGYFHYHHQKAL